MASASVFSESPGSEMSEPGAPTTTENAAHFSFPFSIIRSQRGAISQAAPPTSREKRKSFQERIPSFKNMMNMMSLREEHSLGKLNCVLGSDSSQTNGTLKTPSFPRKPPSHPKEFEGATLVWRDLTVTVGDRKEGVSKAVQGVTGYAKPGTMLAIMGPPDSGNSTLLQALAGKLPKTAKVYGEILRNGQRQPLKNGTYAFVTKDEDLTETLTIRETLFYAALLQLPARLPCSEKISRVDTLISEMDLEDLAGARIGRCGENGGLSIGKRRRVSIALQLLTKPWLVFLDDPISTLDSEAPSGFLTYHSKVIAEQKSQLKLSKLKRVMGVAQGMHGSPQSTVTVELLCPAPQSKQAVDSAMSLSGAEFSSLSAFVVMGMLKKLSNNGCTVVTSLEQMSSDIFSILDKVCLLSSGHTIFFGPASAALEHYANAGMICPAMYNPADHLLRAINTDYDRVNAPCRFGQDSEHGDMWGEMDTAVIIRTLESSYQASGDAAVVQSMVTHLSEKEKTTLSGGGNANPLIRLGVLTWRSFLNMWRDFNYFWLRLILSTLLTLCIGTLGSKIGHSYASLSVILLQAPSYSLLSLCVQYGSNLWPVYSISGRVAAIFCMVSTVSLMAISGFPSLMKDIKVHLAEREIGYSGVLTFTLANLLSSALYLFLISIVCTSVGYFLLGLQTNFSPFVYYVVNLFLCLLTVEGLMLLVAVILPRFLEGVIAVLSIQVLMIIVAGFYQVSGEIPQPVWKYPASYLPFHGYAIEGLLQNEYEDTSFASSSRHTPPIAGQIAVHRAYPFPITTLGKWNILVVLAGMAGGYRILFCITLAVCQKLRSQFRVET